MPRLFALDHNFPKPIVDALGKFQLDAELIRNPQSVFGESRLSTAELVVDPLS